MPKVAKILRALSCLRCGNEWFPRSTRRPKACPRCRSLKWDVPAEDDEKAGRPRTTWPTPEPKKKRTAS